MANKKNKQTVQPNGQPKVQGEKLPKGSKPVERKRTFDTGPTDSQGFVPAEAKKDK